MSLEFIDIVQTGTDEEHPRGSSFIVEKDGLRVLGNLPHGYTFKMKTERDAEKLAEWLKPRTTERLAALDAIHRLMDSEEWDSDTTSTIGEILNAAGYTIHDPNGLEEFDAIGRGPE